MAQADAVNQESIFELVKENLSNFKRIYFINPRNTVGNELGRIKILDLIGKLEEDDAVVWDNFPDDLVRRNLDNARNVLELISSRNVKRFLVALNPKYLEIYSDLHNRIPEFHICEVAFDKEQIKSIIKSYGIEIAQFKKIYQKYIERDIDKISRILWQKEPIPLSRSLEKEDYYKELTNKMEKLQDAAIPQNNLSIDPLRNLATDGLGEPSELSSYVDCEIGLIDDFRIIDVRILPEFDTPSPFEYKLNIMRVASYLELGEKVVVCCSHGMNGSNAIALGVLVQYFKMDFFKAWELIQSRVPICSIIATNIVALTKLFNVKFP